MFHCLYFVIGIVVHGLVRVNLILVDHYHLGANYKYDHLEQNKRCNCLSFILVLPVHGLVRVTLYLVDLT